MSVQAIARRYAAALADVATQRGETREVQQELLAWADMLRASPTLQTFTSFSARQAFQDSRMYDFGITLALVGFASILPATVGAQPPVYLTQWGSPGSGKGQFSEPFGVATDAAGNVYVADRYNWRIQKFTSSGAFLTQWGAFGNGEQPV